MNIQQILEKQELQPYLLKVRYGMEKESQRVTVTGDLVTTDYPNTLGNRTHHPYIQTDFAETQINENEYLFSARLEIDYLNQKYRLDLPVSDDYETLAGLIISDHEDIPAVDEEIQVGDFLFVITRASESRIEEVRLKYNPS